MRYSDKPGKGFYNKLSDCFYLMVNGNEMVRHYTPRMLEQTIARHSPPGSLPDRLLVRLCKRKLKGH